MGLRAPRYDPTGRVQRFRVKLGFRVLGSEIQSSGPQITQITQIVADFSNSQRIEPVFTI